jgi:hypothetical protein
MKGSDSALPIWADFMRTALDLHPEWSGDWTQPDSVRKAEIDIRNGKLIRELDNAQAESVQAQQSALKKNANSNANTNSATLQPTPATTNPDELFVSSVPPEFRRVELFITGTIPLKLLPTEEEMTTDLDVENPSPQPTMTPFETWQDEQRKNKNETPQAEESRPPYTPSQRQPQPPPVYERMLMVTVCPLSGMRATSSCPIKETQNYKLGTEPRDFCTFHTKPRE